MIDIKTFEEFSFHCNNKKCLKGGFVSKNCFKNYKQEKCYKTYIKKFEEKIEDTNKYVYDKEFRQKIIDRDKTCRIWNILTEGERRFVLKNFYDDYISLCHNLDVCHIIPRSQAPDKLYDEENVFLASRYFHSLLDEYKHPVTKRLITKEERLSWCLRANKRKIG